MIYAWHIRFTVTVQIAEYILPQNICQDLISMNSDYLFSSKSTVQICNYSVRSGFCLPITDHFDYY